jgi:hypothetical protein
MLSDVGDEAGGLAGLKLRADRPFRLNSRRTRSTAGAIEMVPPHTTLSRYWIGGLLRSCGTLPSNKAAQQINGREYGAERSKRMFANIPTGRLH